MQLEDAFGIVKTFSSQAFSSGWIPKHGIFLPFRVILSYLQDGLYPSCGIEQGLKDIFGETTCFSDYNSTTVFGTSVVVPVTTAVDNTPCYFHNRQDKAIERSLLGEKDVEL